MTVTIHDVARHAGVSHTTVSWVVHNDKRISQKTREKVQKSIKELNYHPNLAARSLVGGKTNTIAILAPFFATHFEQEIMRGIERSQKGQVNPLDINLYTTKYKNTDVLSEIIDGNKADAAILLSVKIPEPIVDEIIKRKFPVVLVEEAHEKIHHVIANNKNGACRAVEHLILSGRKNIGIVVGEKSENWTKSQKDRFEGYLGALQNHGIEYKPENVEFTKHFYFDEGLIAFRKMTKRNPSIDAVFCAAGDMVAMGILREAKLQNIRIPDDIAVIGFDDIQSSALIQPSLSTMRVPLESMGAAAYEICIQSVVKPDIPVESICYTPELILRDSG